MIKFLRYDFFLSILNKFKILSGITAVSATILSIIGNMLSRLEYQQFYLWKSVDCILFNWFIDISLFLLIHTIVGAIIFCFSFYQCIEIVKINNQAHETKNQPKKLLDSGYYAKTRHPMTARFFLITLSFFFMISSLIGIPLIILFALVFGLITLHEEKKILLPIFGEKYNGYMKQVENRFFTTQMKIVITFLIAFMIIGIIFI